MIFPLIDHFHHWEKQGEMRGNVMHFQNVHLNFKMLDATTFFASLKSIR